MIRCPSLHGKRQLGPFGRFCQKSPSDTTFFFCGWSPLRHFMSVMPSDFANTGNGCIACTSKLNFMQSDLTDTGIGCIACASKLNFMSSDLTDTGIGCIACASKLNFMQSDLTDTGIGCMVCASKLNFMPSDFHAIGFCRCRKWMENLCHTPPLPNGARLQLNRTHTPLCISSRSRRHQSHRHRPSSAHRIPVRRAGTEAGSLHSLLRIFLSSCHPVYP